MDGNRVQLALEAIHGVGAGVGAKNGQCILCHLSSSGGPDNLNGGFGTDFSNTAIARGFPFRGGNSLPASGPNSLESIFSDPLLADDDSDGDGLDNATEFASNNDPADDINEPAGGSGGGGCGMIISTSNGSGFPPHSTLLILLLPLALLLKLRKEPS